MLIESPRHTPDDLALWRQLEHADRVHGRSRELREKVEVAKHAIACFLADGDAYVSVSWGKDSVVAAHLATQINPEIPLVHVRNEPLKNPDCALVRDQFAPRNYLEIEHRWHPGGWFMLPGIYEAERRLGIGRRIIGLRADEAGGRKISIDHQGLATTNSCRPLGRWSADDVFGYLAHNRLPVHPAYAMLGGGRWPRDYIRVDVLGGPAGEGMGKREWHREYYGDVIRRLESAAA